MYILCWSLCICLGWRRLGNIGPFCCTAPRSTITLWFMHMVTDWCVQHGGSVCASIQRLSFLVGNLIKGKKVRQGKGISAERKRINRCWAKGVLPILSLVAFPVTFWGRYVVIILVFQVEKNWCWRTASNLSKATELVSDPECRTRCQKPILLLRLGI